MFGTGEVFAYLECDSCRSLRLAEVPPDMSRYYPRDYYSLDIDPEEALGTGPARWLARLTARSVLRGSGTTARIAAKLFPMREYRTLISLLQSVAKAGLPGMASPRVLDVGCGSGVLVFVLGLADVEAVGIDPFAPCDRRFSSGAVLKRMDLDEVRGNFHLVMLHHSLEHVPDPARTLALCRDRLAPGGRILVRMPTPSSVAFERYGTHWAQLDPPRHLTLPSREGVQQLARRASLRIVSAVDDSTAFQFWGSEQAARGIPLTAPVSQMINPRRSPFSSRQMRGWERTSRKLNAQRTGDQASWVLEPI